MTTKRRALTGDEVDAYGRWRRFYPSLRKAGAVKKIKKSTHRRERGEGKQEIRDQVDD